MEGSSLWCGESQVDLADEMHIGNVHLNEPKDGMIRLAAQEYVKVRFPRP